MTQDLLNQSLELIPGLRWQSLAYHGIRTLKDAKEHGPKELLKFRNIGPKAIGVIRETLRLRLGDDLPPEWVAAKKDAQSPAEQELTHLRSQLLQSVARIDLILSKLSRTHSAT